MNLRRIDRPMTASELRDRALAALNGGSKDLSAADQERRRRVVRLLEAARKAEAGK
jgi:hypothetical protein